MIPFSAAGVPQRQPQGRQRAHQARCRVPPGVAPERAEPCDNVGAYSTRGLLRAGHGRGGRRGAAPASENERGCLLYVSMGDSRGFVNGDGLDSMTNVLCNLQADIAEQGLPAACCRHECLATGSFERV